MGKRKVILIGSSTCGKTTLCQRLNGLTIKYHKTQTIGLINNMIDTPGEYLENRNMYKGIIVAATDSDLVLFLQDATDERFRFSPGQAAFFDGFDSRIVIPAAEVKAPERHFTVDVWVCPVAFPKSPCPVVCRQRTDVPGGWSLWLDALGKVHFVRFHGFWQVVMQR